MVLNPKLMRAGLSKTQRKTRAGWSNSIKSKNSSKTYTSWWTSNREHVEPRTRGVKKPKEFNRETRGPSNNA